MVCGLRVPGPCQEGVDARKIQGLCREFGKKCRAYVGSAHGYPPPRDRLRNSDDANIWKLHLLSRK